MDDDDFIKYTVAPMIGIILFLILFGGCVSSTKKANEEQRFHELLHVGDNYAMKNIDIKEILKKDFC
jgi:hypothetical protein